jgi:antagonist of KipI
MTLRVLSPGLCTLVVDGGRPRTRGLGVPVGGAADRAAWELANALVGNPPGDAALEITLLGPTLGAGCDLFAVLFGAPFTLERFPALTGGTGVPPVLRAETGGTPVPPELLRAGTTFTLHEGETLRIGGTPAGARAYLAVAGGILTPPVLGSRSESDPIAAGRELPCAPGSGRGVALPFVAAPSSDVSADPVALRFLDGAQAEWFDPTQFASAEFVVSATGNRMGLRLDGPALDRPTREMVSEPVCPGSVQVTNEGRCIVLGMDGQTIGGYPKVGQVIAADLDRLGQLRPGRRVRFVRVVLDEAEAAWRERRREQGGWLARLRAAAK